MCLFATACSDSNSSQTHDRADAATDAASSIRHDAGDAASSSPTLSGPVTGGAGKPFVASGFDSARAGYLEEEYFLEGEASAYDFASPPRDDGRWSARPTTSAHYKTRLLVRRPAESAKFNGTVFVEWLNVSGGLDTDADFMFAHVEILRSGFAYVGVSAQATGVVGGGFSISGASQPLVTADPDRYGTLVHPGDDYSYDIYTQAVRALRSPGTARPFGDLVPARFLAAGESQSAFRMVTYIDGVHPLSRAYDGFFVHSRAGGGTPLTSRSDSALGGIAGVSVARIRDDLDVPVLQFLTETDVLGIAGLGGFALARQPDTSKLRSWEVAGTAHADAYLIGGAAGSPAADSGAGPLGCKSINTGPQHWVLGAAVRSMHTWLKDGTPPASGDELVLADGGADYAHDDHGNASGGIRTAAVDVPIATLSGRGDAGNILCSLFGSTTPFTAAELAALYPTHQDYVDKVTAATTKARDAGFIVPEDVPLIEAEADAAAVP